MTTLTIRLSEKEKRLIKMKATHEGKTITQFILEVTGVHNKGSIHQAIEDYEKGNTTKYKNIDELFVDIEKW